MDKQLDTLRPHEFGLSDEENEAFYVGIRAARNVFEPRLATLIEERDHLQAEVNYLVTGEDR